MADEVWKIGHEMRRSDAIRKLKWLLEKVERDEVTVLMPGLITPLPKQEVSFELRYMPIKESDRPDRVAASAPSAGEDR